MAGNTPEDTVRLLWAQIKDLKQQVRYTSEEMVVYQPDAKQTRTQQLERLAEENLLLRNHNYMTIVDPVAPAGGEPGLPLLTEKNHLCTDSPGTHRHLGGLLQRRKGSFTRTPRPDNVRRGSLGAQDLAVPVDEDPCFLKI